MCLYSDTIYFSFDDIVTEESSYMNKLGNIGNCWSINMLVALFPSMLVYKAVLHFSGYLGP